MVWKMKRSGSSHVASHKPHNLEANSGCHSQQEHLDLHNIHLFLRITGHDAHSPECSRETRFDMIILQLGSPLCHMPDLSVGRGMQLALLTVNQPDGGSGGWKWWWQQWCQDREGRMLANISLHTQPTCTRAQTADSSFPSPSVLWVSFVPLYVFLPYSSVLISSLLAFKSLCHPSPLSPNTLSYESSSKSPAGQIYRVDKNMRLSGATGVSISHPTQVNPGESFDP